MASGKKTREYKSVQKHMGTIRDHLKVNSSAKESLAIKYQEEEWIDIGDKPDEKTLVEQALTRISGKASQYHIFIAMLKDIVGMNIVWEKIEDTYNAKEAPSQGSTQPTASQEQPAECILEITDLTDVKDEVLGVAANWRGLGEVLRLHPDVLDTIEANHPKDVTACLTDVLKNWLNKNYKTTRYGSPSWKMLVAAVAHRAGGNNRALAEQIAQKYNVSM